MPIDYRQMVRAADADPRYAEYVKRQFERVQGNQLSQDYSGVEQSLMMAEQARRQQFENTPSDVPVPMRPPEYQAPSPLQQWKERNSAMMRSGNPALQKEAIANMQKIQEASISGPANQPASIQEFLYAKGQGYGGNFEDWKTLNKGGTTINMGGSDIITPADAANMVDSNGYPVTVPVGMTYAEARGKGWSFGKTATEGEAKTEGSVAASVDMLNRLAELTGAEDGAGMFGLSGVIENYRSGSDTGSALLNAALDTFGVKKTPQSVEAMAITTSLGNQLLQAFRGAAVGPAEKADFIKQLPTPGQSEGEFKANQALTLKNLQTIKDRKEKARGLGRGDTPKVNAPSDGLPEGATPYKRPIPTVGSIVNGFVYKGGDPTDKTSWSKQ